MYRSDIRWICCDLSHWDESFTLDRSDITSLNTKSFIKVRQQACLETSSSLWSPLISQRSARDWSLRLRRVISNPLMGLGMNFGRLTNLKAQRVEGEEGRWRWKVPDVHPYNLFLMFGCRAYYSCFPIPLYLFKGNETNRSSSGAADQRIRSLGSVTWEQHQNTLSRKETTAGCPWGTGKHSRGYQELSCSKTSLRNAYKRRKKLNNMEQDALLDQWVKRAEDRVSTAPSSEGIGRFWGDGKVLREQPRPGQQNAPTWPQLNLSDLTLVRLSSTTVNKPAPSVTTIQSPCVKPTWNGGVRDSAASVRYLLEQHRLPESSIVPLP